MSNRIEHHLTAAVSAFAGAAAVWKPDSHWTTHPVVAACVAGGCGTLPDILEPALHPNHRQFFHSVAFAATLGWLLYHLYQWTPEKEAHRVLRGLSLLAGTGYAAHLLMDARTSKSLPLVGRL